MIHILIFKYGEKKPPTFFNKSIVLLFKILLTQVVLVVLSFKIGIKLLIKSFLICYK